MQQLSLILLLSLSAQYQYGVNAESASLRAGSHPRSHATSSAHGHRELGMSDWWSNLSMLLGKPKGHKSSSQQGGGGDSATVAVQQADASDSDADTDADADVDYTNVADGTDGSDGSWTESYLEYNESGGSYVPPSESLITTAGEHAGNAGAMIAALVAAVAGMALVASRKARRNEEDDSSVKDRMHDFVEIAEIKRDSPGSYTARV